MIIRVAEDDQFAPSSKIGLKANDPLLRRS